MAPSAAKRGRAVLWTRERIEELAAPDVMQLRANAERLNEPELVELCSDVLKTKGRARRQSDSRGDGGPGTKARTLVARAKAFEARGVFLQDVRTSWGGIRKSDGGVVMALWAEAIESAEGGCRYLLWSVNADGSRPWSDTSAGKERLEHCKRAVELGRAEGLLVYGQRMEGRLPEDRASAIHGVDAGTVVLFEVVERDQAFWAVWGRKPASPEQPLPL